MCNYSFLQPKINPALCQDIIISNLYSIYCIGSGISTSQISEFCIIISYLTWHNNSNIIYNIVPRKIQISYLYTRLLQLFYSIINDRFFISIIIIHVLWKYIWNQLIILLIILRKNIIQFNLSI